MLSCMSLLNKLNLRSTTAASLLTQNSNHNRFLHATTINAAARKGTREKAKKKKVKVEVKKVGFIPHNQRGKDRLNLLLKNKHIDDSWKAVSTDNVWIGRYYKWRVFTVAEAIASHRETHHPTMYNVPNAPLNVEIELNTQGEKATRFVDNFQRMAMIDHKFEHGEERQIMVLTKGEDNLRLSSEAGAALVGGPDLIKNIQNGDVKLQDYQFVIAHPNIMPEMIPIRGLLKRKFPNPKNGTLGMNLAEMVLQFLNGIQYNCVKDEHQQNYGIIKTCIGTLNMDGKHLEENLVALLKDINTVRPKRDGKFITRVILKSPPSQETLKIDPFLYVPENNEKFAANKSSSSSEDSATPAEEVDEKQTAVN